MKLVQGGAKFIPSIKRTPEPYKVIATNCGRPVIAPITRRASSREQHSGYAMRSLGTNQLVEPSNGCLEDITIEKQKGRQRLSLC